MAALTRARAGRAVVASAAAAVLLGQAGCGYLVPAVALAFLDQGGGSRSVVVLPADGADLLLARGPFDAGDTTEGKGMTLVVGQMRLTATRATTVRRLSLAARGTFDEARLPFVRVHRDANGDGTLDAGDPQLGASASVPADDGVADVALTLDVASGASVDLLVVAATPGDAPDQQTFGFDLGGATSVEAVTVVDGVERPVRVLGAPARTGTKTFGSTGTLVVRPGPAPPPDASALAGTTGLPTLQLDLRASTAEAVRVDRVALRTAGSGDDARDVRAALWLDADSDGRLTSADSLLRGGVAPAADEGALVFDALGQTLAPGAIARWLVVVDLLASAPDGATYQASLAAPTDVTGQGATSLQTIPAAGSAAAGATLTATRPSLTVGAGAANGARVVEPAATGVLGLQLALTAGAAEAVVTTSVVVQASGSADDVADVVGVRLGVDVDGDGALGAGEPTLAGPAAFAQDDGVVALAGFSRALAAGATERWVVVLDLAAAASGGDRVRLALAAPLAGTGQTSGLPVAGGAAGLGGGDVLVAGRLTVSAGPAPPPDATPLANATDVPVLQLVLAPTGTGDDAAGVTAVDLVEDLDADGVVDAGEQLLATGAFPADGAALTLFAAGGLVPGGVAPGAPRTLLVRYRLSGQALQGHTFAASAPLAQLVAVGAASGARLPVGGTSPASAVVTARRARLTLAAGPEAPAAGAVVVGAALVPVLQARVDAGPGEAVDLTGVVVRAAGTADEPSAVAAVRVYLEGAGTGGALDATDTLLAGPLAFASNDGAVTLPAAAPLALGAGGSARLLVTFDVAAGATPGTTLVARLEPPGALAGTGSASGLAAEVAGAAVVGATKTVQAAPPPTPAALVSQAAPVPAGAVVPDQVGREVLQLRVAETSGTGALRLTGLTVVAAGTGQEPADLRNVRLWRDVAPIGSLTGADVAIGLTAFFADDGAATFGGLVEVVPAGGALDLLVTYDLAAAAQVLSGETYRLTVPAGGVAVQVQASGAAVTPTGLPQAGATLTARGVDLDVRAGPGNPAGAVAVRAGARLVPLTQARLTASPAGDVVVARVDVRAAGTADDAADVAALVLLEDGAGDGLVGADDVEVARVANPFAADDGLAAITVSRTIPRGTSVDWLVAYDLGPGPLAARTLAASVEAVDAGTSPVVGALPVAGRTLQVVGGLVASRAPASPGQGVVAPLPAADAPLLLLRLAADPAEAVTLTGLTLRASGSADDAAAFTAVRLWRDDGDGVFEPGAGDALLGAQTFAADDGAVTFAVGEALAAGAALDLWASVDAAAGPTGRTARLRLDAAGDVVAVGAVTGPVGTSGAAVLGAPRTLGWPAGLFQTLVAVDLGGGPAAVDVAAGDLDGDGDLDAAGLRTDGRVAVALGDGAGGFAAATVWPSVGAGVSNPVRLRLADVTRDGYLDLVLAGRSEVRVLANVGALGPATFVAGASLGALGTDLRDLLLVDVDRDGDLDVVVADGSSPSVCGARNDGAGAFPGAALALSLPSAPVRLAALDVDRDGRIDVVATDEGGSARLLRGDGSFLVAADADALGAVGGAVAGADLDRDGDPDAAALLPAADQYVVLRSDAPSAALTLAVGPATTAPSPPLAAPLASPRDLVAGDWDGDGRPDLAIAHAGAADSVVARLGDGALALPDAGASAYAAGSDPDRVVAADLDRDGDPDLLVTGTASGLGRLPGDGVTGGGSAAFHAARAVLDAGRAADVAAADLDVDGAPDLVAVGRDGGLRAWRGAGDGAGFTAVTTATLAGAAGRARLADLDGDGAPDLVVSLPGLQRVDVLAGRRDGSFGLPVAAPLLGSSGPAALALGDLDRDGGLDAAVAEVTAQSVQVLRGVGGALSAALPVDRYPVGGAPRDVALADLDRDGRLDLVVLRSAPAGVEVRRGGAGFSLGAAQTLALAAGLGTPSALAVGDLDRDGRPDLVVASADQAVVEVLRGQGDGTFASQGTRAAAPLAGLALADLDRDGDLDVVGARAVGGGAVVALAATAPASFTFAAPALVLTDGTPGALALADLDRDGDLDVALAAEGARRLAVHLGR